MLLLVLGGVDVGGVDDSVDPICRIPLMFSESGTLTDSAPSRRLMPGVGDDEASGVGDGDGAAVAAMAGMRSSDSDAPTTATIRRIVRTLAGLSLRMSPLRSNRFSRRLHATLAN